MDVVYSAFVIFTDMPCEVQNVNIHLAPHRADIFEKST